MRGSATRPGRCRPGRRYDIYDEPWTIDYPGRGAEPVAPRADRHLDPGQRACGHHARRPRALGYPWIYLVEPGNLRLKDSRGANLREFLLRGGTLTFDDFHGPIEWANLEREMKRVFPDRKIVDLPPTHPIYSCFYQIDGYPQTPGLGSFLQGRTWEKGGFEAQAARHPGRQRPRDGADQLEHRHGRRLGMVERRGLSRLRAFTAQAYRMQINEIVYSLTH